MLTFTNFFLRNVLISFISLANDNAIWVSVSRFDSLPDKPSIHKMRSFLSRC